MYDAASSAKLAKNSGPKDTNTRRSAKSSSCNQGPLFSRLFTAANEDLGYGRK